MIKKITVLAKDIRNGEKNNQHYCPIALSCRRAGYKKIEVSCDMVEMGHPSKGDISTELPLKAQRFIKRFDSGKKVKPFSFLLIY